MSNNTLSFLRSLAPYTIAAAIICSVMIVVLQPLLVRYALARPNARSSHKQPTPQGGGIAVIGGMMIAVGIASVFAPEFFSDRAQLALVFAATLGLAALGATDDVWPMAASPRLLLQAVAVLVVIAALPGDLRVFASLPFWLERALFLIGVLWFVNLVNFMDGIDWMTVAEVVPLTAGIAFFGIIGGLPPYATLIALTLLGGMLGFAPFNRPVARLFLGDVGSLPVGLLLSWLLIVLASTGHVVAAILLPLYYVADATVTLLQRIANREPVMVAHRGHFYQRAHDAGLGVYSIVGRVLALNILLAALAMLTLASGSHVIQTILLAAGCAAVAVLLWSFSRR